MADNKMELEIVCIRELKKRGNLICFTWHTLLANNAMLLSCNQNAEVQNKKGNMN